MKEFRVQLPCNEVGEMLMKLAKRYGYKEHYENKDSMNRKFTYFHLTYSQNYLVYTTQHFKPKKENDFISIDEAVSLFTDPQIKIGQYTCEFPSKEQVEIGCQTISKDKVKEILDILNN